MKPRYKSYFHVLQVSFVGPCGEILREFIENLDPRKKLAREFRNQP